MGWIIGKIPLPPRWQWLRIARLDLLGVALKLPPALTVKCSGPSFQGAGDSDLTRHSHSPCPTSPPTNPDRLAAHRHSTSSVRRALRQTCSVRAPNQRSDETLLRHDYPGRGGTPYPASSVQPNMGKRPLQRHSRDAAQNGAYQPPKLAIVETGPPAKTLIHIICSARLIQRNGLLDI